MGEGGTRIPRGLEGFFLLAQVADFFIHCDFKPHRVGQEIPWEMSPTAPEPEEPIDGEPVGAPEEPVEEEGEPSIDENQIPNISPNEIAPEDFYEEGSACLDLNNNDLPVSTCGQLKWRDVSIEGDTEIRLCPGKSSYGIKLINRSTDGNSPSVRVLGAIDHQGRRLSSVEFPENNGCEEPYGVVESYIDTTLVGFGVYSGVTNDGEVRSCNLVRGKAINFSSGNLTAEYMFVRGLIFFDEHEKLTKGRTLAIRGSNLQNIETDVRNFSMERSTVEPDENSCSPLILTRIMEDLCQGSILSKRTPIKSAML